MQNTSPKSVDLLGLLKEIPADEGKGEFVIMTYRRGAV